MAMKLRSGRRKRKNQVPEDVGFGSKITGRGQRLINADGSFNVLRRGIKTWTPYQDLVEMSWSRFFLLVVVFYVLVNAFFALIYLLIGIEHLSGVVPSSGLENFAEAFFFSVQTFTTVGYGAVNPQGVLANIVAASGALVGLMAFALATGLFFARFSKPEGQLAFSENALIAPYRGITSFQFRIANKRANKMLDLVARVSLSWVEETEAGKRRRYAGLMLERNKIYMLPLNWTIVHPIDSESPLYGKSPQDLERMRAEFLIQIEGHDETYAQMVHVNGSYLWSDLKWNHRFQLMHEPGPEGKTLFHLDRLNDYYPAGEEE
jgi:inward rectifier potassium channel